MDKKKICLIKWHKERRDVDLCGDVGEDADVFIIWKQDTQMSYDKWILEYDGCSNIFKFPTQRAAKKYAETLAILWIFGIPYNAE